MDGWRGGSTALKSHSRDTMTPRERIPVAEAALEIGGAAQWGAGVDGTGRIRIAYKYSDKGRDLYEAGHITGSREYAVGADPFRWPEELRNRVMAGRGAEGDDASAFPRARRAMVPEDSNICGDMLEWKETILETGGAFLFPGTDKSKQRKLMKGVINGFDMDTWTAA